MRRHSPRFTPFHVFLLPTDSPFVFSRAPLKTGQQLLISQQLADFPRCCRREQKSATRLHTPKKTVYSNKSDRMRDRRMIQSVPVYLLGHFFVNNKHRDSIHAPPQRMHQHTVQKTQYFALQHPKGHAALSFFYRACTTCEQRARNTARILLGLSEGGT